MDSKNTNKELLYSDKPIEVKSLEDFYAWIKSKNNFIERINSRMPLGNKFKLFFRGENKINEEILPSIYRNGRIINEHKIFYESLNQSPVSFKECKTTFDKLVIMQHYGIPTRLLDITENPFVALYFSSENFKDDSDGKVYCFFVSEKAIDYPDSFNTSFLSNAAFFDSMMFYNGNIINSYERFIKKFGDFSEEEVHEKRRVLLEEANIEFKSNPIIKLLQERSKNECGYSEPDFSIDSAARILCVKPKYNNFRVMSQGSAFLLFGFLFDKNFCLPLSSFKFFDVFNRVLQAKVNSEERHDAERSFIEMLPLDESVKDKNKNNDKDFSLFHFASDRKSDLSREMFRHKPRLLKQILDDEINLPLNTTHYYSTRNLSLNIKDNLKNYFILDNLINYLWGNYPVLFYDEIVISKDVKNDIQKELSYVNISKVSLFPELESSSKEISYKYDHSQPLIIIKHKNDLVVYHIDKNVKTDLCEGDIIVSPKFDSVDEFWGSFVIHESLNLIIRRKSENDKIVEIPITINCYDFSTKDNPLFANFSEH